MSAPRPRTDAERHFIGFAEAIGGEVARTQSGQLEITVQVSPEAWERARARIFHPRAHGPGIHTREGTMAEKARCKFKCMRTTQTMWGVEEVELGACYDPELSEEDEAFSDATPVGKMEFDVNNPALEGFFEPGRAYYIDITPVPEAGS